LCAAGFVLTSSGIIVTNYHVVHDHDSVAIVVRTFDGQMLGVKEVLAADAEHDVAVLQTTGKDLTPIPLSADAPAGSPITVISHPNHNFYYLTQGVVSRYYLEGPARTERMAITADFARGSSGAPAINECGAAIGMVRTTDTIHYDFARGMPRNPQMVIKSCVLARHIRALFK
jgi:S1-C subfamily serine protease